MRQCEKFNVFSHEIDFLTKISAIMRLRFLVNLSGSAALGAMFKGKRLYNRANSHRQGASMHKLCCATQKRGFACAVNILKYIEYNRIYKY